MTEGQLHSIPYEIEAEKPIEFDSEDFRQEARELKKLQREREL